MKTLRFQIIIQAPRQLAWDTMLAPDTYQQWTTAFCEGSCYEGSWDKGSTMLFLGPNGDGMKAVIAENHPLEYLSIRHLCCLEGGVEKPFPQPAFENYTFRDHPDGTELIVEMDTTPEYEKMFCEMWPGALQLLKTICEQR
jgi:uncharacterized protein YndB with AHSA1/START domain